MKSYHSLLRKILEQGERRQDRTGKGTISLFGETWEHDLADGFPLLTTKKVRFKGVAAELFWFLEGSTNVNRLRELGAKIWDPWADENGELGPIYGKQWRNAAGGIDQLQNAITMLKQNPHSRRILVCSWQAQDVHFLIANTKTPPPCHCLFQFYVRGQCFLDVRIDQRSCDFPIGAPYNMASYAILNHLVSAYVGLTPGRVIFQYGDLHVYQDQEALCYEQLSRKPKALPTLQVEPVPNTPIWDWGPGCLRLEGYQHEKHIPYPVAV